MVKFECGKQGPGGKSRYRLRGDNAVKTPPVGIRPLSLSTTHRKQHSLSHFSIQLRLHTQNHIIYDPLAAPSYMCLQGPDMVIARRLKHALSWGVVDRVQLGDMLLLVPPKW